MTLQSTDYLERPTISVWLPSPRQRGRSIRLSTPLTKLTSTTASVDLESRHELRVRQMVRIQIGAASTAAIVTGIESNPLTTEIRYEVRFENTTPSFHRAVAEALGEATVTSLANHARRSQAEIVPLAA